MLKQLFNTLCGHHIDMPQALHKPINYVMAKNGCFEMRDTPLGRMTIRVEEEIAGLTSVLEEGIELDIPLIPGRILTTVVKFFRAVYHEKHGAEAFLQIFYHPHEEEFFLHCPRQQVSGALVRFERDPELEANAILVMDIHSHNSMPAFFSSIDNEDEKEDRLYGVVGCVHQRLPHLSFRMGVAGRFVELEGRSLFDEAEPAMNFPQTWLDLCEYAPFGHHRQKNRTTSNHAVSVSATADMNSQQTTHHPRWPTSVDNQPTTNFHEVDDSWFSSDNRHRFSSRRRKIESWGAAWDEVFSQAGIWVEDIHPFPSSFRRTWL